MKLPQTVVNYIAAVNAADGNAAAALFTANAVVRDENAEHHGPAAISAWVEETAGRYHFQVTPLDIPSVEEHLVVSCEVKGDFPGSPVTLAFDFTLTGDRIASLSIE
jgi:molybdopterin-guanine dinucleotide biosynthesis protein A